MLALHLKLKMRHEPSYIKKGTSLVVQWLRLCASTEGNTGSIPGQ